MNINKNASLCLWCFYFLLGVVLIVLGCFGLASKYPLVSGVIFLTLAIVATNIFTGKEVLLVYLAYMTIGILFIAKYLHPF